MTSQVSIEPISLVGGILNIGSRLDTICSESLQWLYKHVKCGSKRFHIYLREKAVKLTVQVANNERVLRKALILAESLGQGQSSALAQPLKQLWFHPQTFYKAYDVQWYLGEGTLTVTLALSLTVALTELAFASPLARNLGIIVNISGPKFPDIIKFENVSFSKSNRPF